MVAAPATIPVTIPEVPMVATAVLLLLQVPEGVRSVRVVVRPVQTALEPDIDNTDGSALTVIVVVVTQPVGRV